MMTKLTSLCGALALVAASACGDDGAKNPDAAKTPDAPPDGPTVATYKQVDQLARPGINEALLITNDYLNGYNATAPTFTGVDAATLGAVVGEAKTVLKAIYLGTCLVDGALGLTPTTGLHPGGMACAEVGPAIWTEGNLTGVTLKQSVKDGAQAYADAVFGLFEPDVMRIDTAAASEYLTLCGGPTGPLLCGGRLLNDDVIDITYNFLIAGAAVPKGAYDQVHALVSDGVVYDKTNDVNNPGSSIVAASAAGNPQQGHPAISASFPYSAAPF